MGKLALIAIAAVVVILVAGGIILSLWDIPAPKSQVEKVIPDAKFPK
jgi:small neutral amino acid transporter SnatA (MarC family)